MTGQGLAVVEQALSGWQFLAQESIFAIRPLHHGVDQKGQENQAGQCLHSTVGYQILGEKKAMVLHQASIFSDKLQCVKH